jgi:hypothetical protein
VIDLDVYNSTLTLGYGDGGYWDNSGSYNITVWQSTVVPEPVSSILFATGGIVLVGRRYLRRTKSITNETGNRL